MTDRNGDEGTEEARVTAAARALRDDEIRGTVNRLGARIDAIRAGITLELDPLKGDVRRALAIVEGTAAVVGRIDDRMRALGSRVDALEEHNEGIDRERARMGRKLDSLTEEVDEVREVTGSGRHVAVSDAGAVLAQAIALEGNATEHRKSLEAELNRERARAADLEARLLGREDKATERRWQTWHTVLTVVLAPALLAFLGYLLHQSGREQGRKDHRDRGAETNGAK